jgi:MFS transporter, DHA3 family, macrolide efflux protein
MAFFTRGFVLLWQGQLASQLGHQAFLIAAAYAALEATGSPLWVAAVMVAATTPIVVLGPLGGTIADRHSRRSILILTDVARAVAIGGLGAFYLWWPDVSTSHVRLTVMVAAFGGTMGALFAPAVQAFIPDLVPGERLAAANSVNQISIQTSVLVGQASGGLLYAAWGPSGLLIFNACTFAYAALAAWCIRVPPRPRPPRAPLAARGETPVSHRGRRGAPPARRDDREYREYLREEQRSRRGCIAGRMPLAFHHGLLGAMLRQYVADTREGVAYVWARPSMRAVLAVFAGVNMLFMPVVVLLPFYVSDAAGGGPAWYGFLLAVAGAGALTGSAASAIVLPRVRARGRLVRLAVAGIGGSVLLVSTHVLWLALGAFAVIGVLSSMINVIVVTRFQATVPSEMRGRVMALIVSLSTAATPIGMALGGVLGDLWRDALTMVFAGCGGAIILVAAAATRASGFEARLDARDAPAEHGE